MQKTKSIKQKEVKRDWYLIDATGVRLGDLASFVAPYLMGKNKPYYTPHVDCGDHIVIVNSKNIDVHQRKLDQKMYRSHSGYPGGFKEVTLKEKLEKSPNEVIERAVKGMLPKSRLGKNMVKKLHVFEDEKHGFDAQKPKEIKVK